MKLHDRMKMYESSTTSVKLMAKLPIMVRLDGKNFSSFTKQLEKPFDIRLTNLMIETTKFLAELTNAKLSYTQSDEITLLLYSDDIESETYLNRRLFKLETLLSSYCSVFFNSKLKEYLPEKSGNMPVFDCRVWNVPTLEEATNVFLWRERDCTKNAITMASSTCYSNSELMGKNGSEKQEMLFEKGINFNDYIPGFKRGTYIQRRTVTKKLTIDEINDLPEKHLARKNPELEIKRSSYTILDMPIFGRISNKTEVVFNGEEPKLYREDNE